MFNRNIGLRVQQFEKIFPSLKRIWLEPLQLLENKERRLSGLGQMTGNSTAHG
jgi:hypothetical protein